MLGMLKALPVIGEASGPFRAKLIAAPIAIFR